MLVSWLIYALAVSGAVALAAFLAEGAVRALGRPARWVWAGGLLAAVGLPVLAHLAPGLAPAPMMPATGAPVILEEMVVASGTSGGGLELVPLLVGAWLAASGILLLLFVQGCVRLAVWRRAWELRVVDGRLVFLSEETGPAVVGVWPGRIVLPRWILSLDGGRRGMVLAHETEHVRAGDPLLLLLAGIPVMAFPWNPFLWWMRRRLRAAVEIDCDDRVVERDGPERREYGELLLDVGGRSRAPVGLVPGFAERASLLERRIVALSQGSPERPLRRAAYFLAGAAGLVLLACGIPAPDALTGPRLEEEAAADAASPALEARPTFTPFTVKPELTNMARVQQAMEAAYPPLLRDAGVGGTTTVWFFIDASGRVEKTRVARSSGHEALDRAALDVAAIMEFTAALNRDEPVPVWVQFPITFQVR